MSASIGRIVTSETKPTLVTIARELPECIDGPRDLAVTQMKQLEGIETRTVPLSCVKTVSSGLLSRLSRFPAAGRGLPRLQSRGLGCR